MKELCPNCSTSGRCLFEEYASLVAKPLNSESITDQDILRSAAFEVHQKISEERIEARKRSCPNLNKIDPDYQGKELL